MQQNSPFCRMNQRLGNPDRQYNTSSEMIHSSDLDKSTWYVVRLTKHWTWCGGWMSFVTPPIDTDLHSENYVLMSTHGGGCARGRRRRFSCRQLVAALLATVPFLSQLRAHGTVCHSLWHLRRHYWRSGGSWRQRCSTAPTPDSSLTAICFCFLLDTVTCPCSFIY